MIGMVLAAGVGRRLRPYTDRLPKTLLPVDGDNTILDIALANLAAVGITDVVLVLGHASETVHARQDQLERRHHVNLVFVHNDKAEEWNNAYSLWTARRHLDDDVLLLNGDTVHPVSVEETLLRHRGSGMVLAVDTSVALGEEQMKVAVDRDGALVRITKMMDPAGSYGEYIGATLIEAEACHRLIDALRSTWRHDPDLYYEDAYQALVDAGNVLRTAAIAPGTPWVEVDDQVDLARAREIACLC